MFLKKIHSQFASELHGGWDGVPLIWCLCFYINFKKSDDSQAHFSPEFVEKAACSHGV